VDDRNTAAIDLARVIKTRAKEKLSTLIDDEEFTAKLIRDSTLESDEYKQLVIAMMQDQVRQMEQLRILQAEDPSERKQTARAYIQVVANLHRLLLSLKPYSFIRKREKQDTTIQKTIDQSYPKQLDLF
jgi:hypothetical protein